MTNILSTVANLLKVPPPEVEAVLREDETRARDTLNRRRFMGAAAALAGAPFVPGVWSFADPEGRSTLFNFNELLKERFKPELVQHFMFAESPMFQMVKREIPSECEWKVIPKP